MRNTQRAAVKSAYRNLIDAKLELSKYKSTGDIEHFEEAMKTINYQIQRLKELATE